MAADPTVALNIKLTPELKREGLMREVVRYVQNARKQADLQIDNRIHLVLQTDSEELKQAIHEHLETIKQETLANNLTAEGIGSFEVTVKVDNSDLNIKIQRVD